MVKKWKNINHLESIIISLLETNKFDDFKYYINSLINEDIKLISSQSINRFLDFSIEIT